jgi:uncharacterized membrane protein
LAFAKVSATFVRLVMLAKMDLKMVLARGKSSMRRWLLILGLLALALGLLWIGQGTGVVAWPQASFMINQIEWAGYGAVVGALGLIMIWQATR